MHLPIEATATVLQSGYTQLTSATESDSLGSETDWELTSGKGGMLEPPSSNASSSPPTGTQDLWWTEQLVLHAKQEFPGELGECAL